MYAVGIDIGSTSGEALILDGDQVLAWSVVDTGYNSRRAAALALDEALAQSGLARDELDLIVAGICRSIARRVGNMARRVGVEPPVAFAGGVAKNVGVVRALEEALGEALIVPEEPQIVGALGAALVARDGQD